MTNPESSKTKACKQPSGSDEKNFAKAPLKNKISNSLKQMYDDVVNQPVPDDFLKLLIEADEKSK